MKYHVIERSVGDVPVGALVMLPLFALPLGAWAIENAHVVFSVCGMKRLAGLPCLTCGATRATLHLFHGEPLAALSMQPMMISLYLLLLVWGMISLVGFVKNRRVILEMSRKEDIAFKASLVLVPLINWIYLVWAGI
ncbi:MAG: DUF2752 domain-containing protein [Bradymonadaceae bacterium]|nr:DUF2752 domain-containing protein [Lujinxingiaceae bacterium]